MLTVAINRASENLDNFSIMEEDRFGEDNAMYYPKDVSASTFFHHKKNELLCATGRSHLSD